MNVNVNKVLEVSEKDIFDYIINPENFSEDDTRDENGKLDKKAIVICFSENFEYCLSKIMHVNVDDLNITFSDRVEMLNMFETFVKSNC